MQNKINEKNLKGLDQNSIKTLQIKKKTPPLLGPSALSNMDMWVGQRKITLIAEPSFVTDLLHLCLHIVSLHFKDPDYFLIPLWGEANGGAYLNEGSMLS